ncbi:MAG: 2-amino-4-hydroxy-6-hydroxymethyldihydropteridine diphosphokinase [Candidatus Peregrinibacteria bacterium]|nr:2-amino-4-hydroxy-6-hydroxymethyldihydropteridine diphosphokinase [Candidatus Peregrinibacteria bacterium]
MIFLSLGSSIGNAEKIFRSTEEFLENSNIKVLKKSQILKNPPLGEVAKNEFSNAVWQIETDVTPEELLKTLKSCETTHGRDLDAERWSDRLLDLDILTFNNEIINTETLKIPHPEIPNRIFVLQPWSEIVDENFKIPKFGTLKSLLTRQLVNK